MAHIFKYPNEDTKGIIIFTHKEVAYFTKFWKKTRYDWFNNIQGKILPADQLKPTFSRHFNAIKEKYFIGMHFGWHHENYPTLPFIDFYMGGKGTVTFQNPENIFFIPLNSRSFSSSLFSKQNSYKKYWDIICVSNNSKFKNLGLFLKTVRKLYDHGKKYKVLLLVTSKKNETPERFYIQLEDDYHSLFSSSERELFTLMKLSPTLSFTGLPQSTLSHFYAESKVFTLFSNKEGESRVISEALLSGLMVVVKNDLQGGGRDLLDDSNSIQFSEYHNAYQTLIEAVEHYKDYNIPSEEVKKITQESYTVPLLKSYFKKLYHTHDQHFDGELINCDRLAFRLPAHEPSVPWNAGRLRSADIVNKKLFKIFLKHLQL